MTELGQMLRDARESKGVSLAEVEAVTRIRLKYLQALEESNYSVLPPGVYVRGFLRSYANYLGLDPEAVVAAYQNGVEQPGQPAEPNIISEPLTPGSPINWELIAGVLMLIAVGVILILVYRQYIAPLATRPVGPTPTAPEVSELALVETPVLIAGAGTAATPTPTKTATATSTPLPPTPVPPTPTATRTRRPTPTRTPRSMRTQELTLALKATARSWIRVVLDGQTAFEGTLIPGDERTWKARREILLRTGNAGGIIASIGGRELGALGNSGQVLDYIWQLSDGGEIIMGTPTP